ncbi:DMT family transporter [Acinetobacter pullicarnis]|uniref:DMT family transporter n=1 Tax=Acinetobacter pullicarnis TaxID=2576829 RepID=UPI001121C109|nr:DMT family transporter [Acinetobacter pullicarnis]
MKITAQVLVLLPFAIGIGVAMALQTALNAQLRSYLYSPLQAALLSFIVGTLLLSLLVFFQQSAKPNLSMLGLIPWYLWLGGCLGVYAISMSIYTVPQLGFLTLSGLIIFGQIVMSMLLDHFAWFGIEKTEISWSRCLGAVIIFIGVMLTLQR